MFSITATATLMAAEERNEPHVRRVLAHVGFVLLHQGDLLHGFLA
jgi:hypothetical protein